eukprot:8212487-Ditylum_brightwellii.AAC.2
MGFHWSALKAIIFATQKYSGVQLIHPQFKQVIAKINFVVKHLQVDLNVGKVITIALRWVQLCAGTSWHILQNTRPILHMEGVWIEHLQNGMEHINAEIRHKHKWVVPAQRKVDKHIMDKFLESNLIPANVMKHLNYGRYYVEATTLAGIVSSDGKRIEWNCLIQKNSKQRKEYGID